MADNPLNRTDADAVCDLDPARIVITNNATDGSVRTNLGKEWAELTFRLELDRMVIIHTGVPGEFEGRGIGGALVKAAVNLAIERNLIVVPHCGFARAWLQDRPEIAAQLRVE